MGLTLNLIKEYLSRIFGHPPYFNGKNILLLEINWKEVK